jgi:hypothetical protein
MPRYYFDVIDEGLVQVDEVGLEFENLAMAVAEAQRAVSEMVLELDGREAASVMIQVRDGAATPVTTVVATRATLPHVRSASPRLTET